VSFGVIVNIVIHLIVKPMGMLHMKISLFSVVIMRSPSQSLAFAAPPSHGLLSSANGNSERRRARCALVVLSYAVCSHSLHVQYSVQTKERLCSHSGTLLKS